MPKPKHPIDAYCMQRLKDEVQIFVGIRVSNRPSCNRLREELFSNYGFNISLSTLARFFLETNADNHFYLDTLDKFCNLVRVGCDWNSYCQQVIEQRDKSLSLGLNNESDIRCSLLYINFENSGWKSLHSFFDRIESFVDNANFHYLSFNLGVSLHKILAYNPLYERSLYKHFISYPSIRRSYFELLADPEFKLPDYKNGLSSYGKTIDYSSPNASNDLCFYLAMICLKEEKNGSISTFRETAAQLIHNFSLRNIIELNIHPFNIGRFLAVKLIYTHLFKLEDFDQHFNDILHFVKSNINSWNAYQKRLVLFYLIYGLNRTSSSYSRIRLVESVFDLTIVDPNNFNQSVLRFLYEKEPNTLLWLRRVDAI